MSHGSSLGHSIANIGDDWETIKKTLERIIGEIIIQMHADI